MFIETNLEERLINLYLLQDVKTITLNTKYYVRFVFTNGEVYDEEYSSLNAANSALSDYKEEILSK